MSGRKLELVQTDVDDAGNEIWGHVRVDNDSDAALRLRAAQDRVVAARRANAEGEQRLRRAKREEREASHDSTRLREELRAARAELTVLERQRNAERMAKR